MLLKLLVTVLFINIVMAAISLDVNINNKEANVTYRGTETRALTDEDVRTIIGKEKLRQAFIENVRIHGRYHDYDKCGPAERALSIQSVTVKSLNMEPVIVVSQDFENSSNHTIKVNAGISHSVENTLTTSWSREREYSLSQDVEYEISVGFSGFGGSYGHKNGFSFSTKGGVSEEKSKSETIGTTSSVEVELKPGDAVTTILSANAGSLVIEVVHQAYLVGSARIHCDCTLDFGIRSYIYKSCETIKEVMESGGIKNNLTTTETIKFSFYVEGRLRVYEKKTGQLLI